MPSFIGQLGMQTAGQAVGAGMGLLLGGVERRRQMEQQKQLQEMQIAGQKQMTDYQMKQQLAMWKATGPMGQMEQLKLAGLNPGLIYGMAGAGGQTAQVAQGQVQGGQVHRGGEALAMGMQMGQTALMAAQIENLKAQSNKTNVEAAKIGGVDTEFTHTQIASLTQGIENQKAQQALTNVQTEIAELQAKLQAGTLDTNIATAKQALDKLTAETKSALAQANVDEATQNDKITLVGQEIVRQTAQIELTKAQEASERQGIKLSMAQITNMAEQIAQGWAKIKIETEGLEIGWAQSGAAMGQSHAANKNATTNALLADFERSFGKQAAGIAGNVMQGIGFGVGLSRSGKATTIKGFGKGK